MFSLRYACFALDFVGQSGKSGALSVTAAERDGVRPGAMVGRAGSGFRRAMRWAGRGFGRTRRELVYAEHERKVGLRRGRPRGGALGESRDEAPRVDGWRLKRGAKVAHPRKQEPWAVPMLALGRFGFGPGLDNVR